MKYTWTAFMILFALGCANPNFGSTPYDSGYPPPSGGYYESNDRWGDDWRDRQRYEEARRLRRERDRAWAEAERERQRNRELEDKLAREREQEHDAHKPGQQTPEEMNDAANRKRWREQKEAAEKREREKKERDKERRRKQNSKDDDR